LFRGGYLETGSYRLVTAEFSFLSEGNEYVAFKHSRWQEAMENRRAEYNELTTGYEFAPKQFRLDKAMVAAYLKAVEGDTHVYEELEIVPPMAIAALAMTALSEGITFPSGAIHVSQELQFLDIVSLNETLTSQARISRKLERGKFHMLTISISVQNEQKIPVLAGETSFILPLKAMEEKQWS
jgi:acyl dehydratase